MEEPGSQEGTQNLLHSEEGQNGGDLDEGKGTSYGERTARGVPVYGPKGGGWTGAEKEPLMRKLQVAA